MVTLHHHMYDRVVSMAFYINLKDALHSRPLILINKKLNNLHQSWHKEEFKDTKVAIRKSKKGRKHNCQKIKKDKRTNNDHIIYRQLGYISY